jgi:DNA-binding IclR family transcriptional regulator
MSQSPAQFAVRTLRALEMLAFAPASAPQVADALGIHPRTARRLLSQLRRDGWLYYNPRPPQVYAPTLRLVALAAQVGARAPIATLAAPAVERLHAETGLDALVAIPSYQATVCVVRCRGDRATQPPLGEAAPAHCSATGKVLLAYRDAWRRTVLAGHLTRVTDRTITDARELARELERIQRDGYATEDGERVDGVRQLAAPITIPRGETVAALGASIHDARPLIDVRDHVMACAGAVSDAIAAAANRQPLHRGITCRMLTTYGLAPVDAGL